MRLVMSTRNTRKGIGSPRWLAGPLLSLLQSTGGRPTRKLVLELWGQKAIGPDEDFRPVKVVVCNEVGNVLRRTQVLMEIERGAVALGVKLARSGRRCRDCPGTRAPRLRDHVEPGLSGPGWRPSVVLRPWVEIGWLYQPAVNAFARKYGSHAGRGGG